jgi:HlyD family secretion protein
MRGLTTPRWRWRSIVVGVLILAALILSYRTFWNEQADHRPLHVTGTIEATEVEVTAKYSGRIKTLPVREGATVKKGDLLALLDDEELRAEVTRLTAAVRTARANLQDLLAGTRREEIEEAKAAVARARAQLDDLKAGARPQEFEQARSALLAATATREWAESDLRRAEELLAKGLIATADRDRARQAYAVALGQERSAREQLRLLETGPRPHQVTAAEAQLKAAQDRLELLQAGPRPQQVEAARAQVNEATAALAQAEARRREMRIEAPISGVVLRKNLEVGETANPGVPIVTLIDPNELWLRGYVPETDVGRIKVGQTARVMIDAFPNRPFSGKLSEISSEAEFTPKNVQTQKERVNLVFRVKISVDNPDSILKPGLPADAEIVLNE